MAWKLNSYFDCSNAGPPAAIRCLGTLAAHPHIDLADASIVVRSELHVQVFTVDRRDFSIYRRNDRQMIEFVERPNAKYAGPRIDLPELESVGAVSRRGFRSSSNPSS